MSVTLATQLYPDRPQIDQQGSNEWLDPGGHPCVVLACGPTTGKYQIGNREGTLGKNR
jgi:hypothetical protein